MHTVLEVSMPLSPLAWIGTMLFAWAAPKVQLPFVQCGVALFQSTSCWCSLHACLVKTRGLDHYHLRFCLVRVLSSWQITWDWEMAIPIFGNCPGCMVKGFDSWFIWAVHEAKPECLTIMAYHNSQLFIQASNRMGCAWGSRFWGAGGRYVFVLMLHL